MIYKFFRFGFFCSCLFIFFSFCISSDAVEFTNAVTLGSGDTTYDHANVVANGCVLTIEGNHSFGDLTVTNAGTVVFNGTNLNLTGLQLQNSEFQMAGGATVDVVNAVSLQSSSTLLVQSVHTDAQVSNQWKGVGGTIHAGTVSVDAGSAISADAQGYAGGSGDNDPGKGPGGGRPREGSSYGAGGGGYGGAGGSYLAYVGGSAYGSSTGPLGPGSGGASDRSSNYQGGRGGGSIRLSVDGTLTLDGLISADGESRSSYYEGGGSGGAIWVTAGTLAGQGAFLARGGAASGSYTTAGGGGRIAVYYEADEGFADFAASSAAGGSGRSATYDGSEGTLAFFDTSVNNNRLRVLSRFELPSGSNDFYSIELFDAAVMSIGTSSVLTVSSDVAVGGGSTLTLGGGSTFNVGGLLSVSNNSTVAGGGLHTDAQVDGVWAGEGVTINADSMVVESNSVVSADAQGYAGGSGDNDPGKGPGGGLPRAGTSYGAGGGGYGGAGGSYYSYVGGEAYGSSTEPLGPGSGGASDRSSSYQGGRGGGSIRLSVDGTLTLDGVISADGESRTGSNEGGGSGGAIWVTAGTLAGQGSFHSRGGSTTETSSTAGGGGRIAVYYQDASGFSGFSSSSSAGGSGGGASVRDGSAGTLNFVDASSPHPSLMITEYLDLGTVSNQYNQVTVLDGAQLVIGEGSHFEVDTDVRLEGSSGFSIGGGSTVAIHGNLDVLDHSTLNAGSFNGDGVTLTAWHITVDSNAVIKADGTGYSGGSSGPGSGPGAGSASSDYAAGGGHGGTGGAGRNGSPAGGAVYGSTRRPTEPGSGGGSAGGSGTGGAGGGALRIIAWEQLHLDGGLQADGGNATASSDSGGGAGGSIWVDAAVLSGSGWMSAAGGDGRYDGGAGGGGCIAAYYWDASTWIPDVLMSGGSDYRDGASGTFVTGRKSAYWWLGSELAMFSDGAGLGIDFMIPGKTHVVERRQSLTSGEWELVRTVEAQGSQTNLSLLPDESWQEVYYRVQTQITVPELDE